MEMLPILLIPLYLILLHYIDKLKVHWGLKYLLYLSSIVIGGKLYLYYL